MSQFTVSYPASVDEALGLASDEESIFVGGATSLGLLMKNRLIDSGLLIPVADLPELGAVQVTTDGVTLGGAVRLDDIAKAGIVREALPALGNAAAQVGNARVRAMATLAGAIVHGDPRQDLPPVLMALGASVVVRSRNGAREIPISSLYVSFMETALEPGELVTEVRIPRIERQRCVYSRFTPGSNDDYPTVGVAVALVIGEDGVVEGATVAVGGVGPTARVISEVGEALVGLRPSVSDVAAAGELAASLVDPTDDQRGSSAYKKAMTNVWVRRSLEACLG